MEQSSSIEIGFFSTLLCCVSPLQAAKIRRFAKTRIKMTEEVTEIADESFDSHTSHTRVAALKPQDYLDAEQDTFRSLSEQIEVLGPFINDKVREILKRSIPFQPVVVDTKGEAF